MRTNEVIHPERVAHGKALDGVRILAVEQMQALPYATQLLSHLGAEVVKVEHPLHGESGRGARPTIQDSDGREVGATYLRNNLNKKSIAINLKDERGRQLLRDLLPHFDVFAENMKLGSVQRLGLSAENLRATNPKLIYLSLSGFGKSTASPYQDWPAYAPIAEAMAGFYECLRKPGAPPPVVVAGALGDIGSALFAAIGVFAALRQREQTGLGQEIDISMFDSMVAMADMVPFFHSMGVPSFQEGGVGYGIIAGFRANDGYFVLQVIREHQFEKLCHAIKKAEWLEDERLQSREGWSRHLDEIIRPAIEEWAQDKTRLEACAELCGQGRGGGSIEQC